MATGDPTQTYAERVKARPAYATYKNSKRAIRRRLKRGTIDWDQREVLMAEARAAYHKALAANGEREMTASLEAFLNGEKYLDAGYPVPDLAAIENGACGPICVGAKKRRCTCDCGGFNHGAAYGMPITSVGSDTLTWLRKDYPEWAAANGILRKKDNT